MELLYRSRESRKVFTNLNASHKGFVPWAEMCSNKKGGNLTNEREVIERWRKQYDEHLNTAQTGDQDGVEEDYTGAVNNDDVPPPTMVEVKEAMIQFKNHKAAGKNGLEFVYHGSLITIDNNNSCEIRRRIVNGSRAYYGLRKSLRYNKLRPRTKCTMYKSLIRPVVLYGHVAWTMLEEDSQALGVNAECSEQYTVVYRNAEYGEGE
ncbi:uncharacterized protein LOC129779641 [Toxorhynchites rutilus septentrionalis]|uniref:uncharacterized protein LOC129779641 n=1 Tax=Toxorhynchites rutilus septentrionalis TaxID=329112 RepID=UPI002479D1A1|nr:uncharacterized protein LOC129779641 [Toxorhynchites rutilus septentrionalis]XP_055643204.1 uncharacterized protein LOC129779641 [Toxorhynchites rutilus septentrionalis]XP_055643205.1 uncharacterized protein LOC129779641 [Toxorhynchites rutilus septentrionalis]